MCFFETDDSSCWFETYASSDKELETHQHIVLPHNEQQWNTVILKITKENWKTTRHSLNRFSGMK